MKKGGKKVRKKRRKKRKRKKREKNNERKIQTRKEWKIIINERVRTGMKKLLVDKNTSYKNNVESD